MPKPKPKPVRKPKPKPVRKPKPKPVRKPKPKPVRKPKPKSDPIEDQHRLELAIQAARQAAHAGTLLSKQLGKKPRQLAAIRLADHG